jgi:hypothetical protein
VSKQISKINDRSTIGYGAKQRLIKGADPSKGLADIETTKGSASMASQRQINDTVHLAAVKCRDFRNRTARGSECNGLLFGLVSACNFQ